MSKFESGHPDEGRLLQYLDGELPAREARRTERHLQSCWTCRAEAEGLDKAVAECVEYRKSLLQKYLPEPPQPWADLYGAFARLDAAEAEAGWMARMMRPFRAARWRWAVAAAAAAMVLGAIFLQLHETPSVQAAALLNRAVAVRANVPKARHIRIRTRSRQITRLIDGTAVRPAVAGGEDEAVVEALFVKARYDWDDPLSARSYQVWRDGLVEKRDEVSTLADPDRPSEKQYRIRTATASGALAAASLTLRATDLHPVESRLEFRDQEWVELTEIQEPSMSGTDLNVHLEVPSRPAEPSLPAAQPPRETASISDELQVVATLHEIGADLGDPVEVSLADGQVLVSGVGIAPRRQKQIHELLDSRPGVKVEFAEPAGVPSPGEGDSGGRAAAPPVSTPPGSPQARLEQQVGGRAELERISAQVLDWNEAAMARAYALRTLAQRFPVSAEAGMQPQDRRLLADLGREHVDAMLGQVRSIRNGLGPILARMGARAEAGSAPAGGEPWQVAAEDTFRTARRVEVLLSVVMGASSGGTPQAEQPSQLLTALTRLETELEECQRLFARPAGG